MPNARESLKITQTGFVLKLKIRMKKGTYADMLQNHPLGITPQSLSLPIFMMVGSRVVANNAFLNVSQTSKGTTVIKLNNTGRINTR
jgi:hypothetical protein